MKKNEMKHETEQSEMDQVFLTVENAFDSAIKNLKDKDKLGKIYVWRQRFRQGTLSHKKVEAILKNAGFHKVVEERWMPIELPISETPIILEEEEVKTKKTKKKKVVEKAVKVEKAVEIVEVETFEKEEVEIFEVILEEAFPI
jgi:hypothetical protein